MLDLSKLSFAAGILMVLMIAGWHANSPTRFTIDETSKLWVTGTSSLHDWQCDARQVEGWIEAEIGAVTKIFAGGEITIPAISLECKNGTMDKKAQNALKSDDHPLISFVLSHAEVVKDSVDTFSIATTGQLSIAGVVQTVSMNVSGSVTPDGNITLAGSLPLTMTAFDIKPPKAMLGTLKTGDEITVHFEATATARSDS